ncbi:succinate dehydrogenase, cytochrome b556 subunit [Sediminicurvatus halobius]|uniref:Succinate dehydrogenase cytochrome b556 subunit n=1 Tax=Sediminicurvatus halobius TaxID=2182432 RepID=A0A2U2N8B9_9GAMM|nr:succinate dehydrogenase, cytochrome b556 subunit [Spiribacter halobius]PWG65421.1 succinate dehydrogenase, cytochrome b556 subunit [Spiribacter halobius]UEX76441.1 succinate dehydrogenase, cytochrome b556 subunit [Spiribacter halobius]
MSAGRAARVAARSHPAYIAFVLHRVSGVALTLFLPLHFWALSQALNGAEALDGFLAWADRPLLKFAETGLVLMLSLHLAGGLRLLALELLAWREWQKSLAAVGAGASLAVTLVFALRLV